MKIEKIIGTEEEIEVIARLGADSFIDDEFYLEYKTKGLLGKLELERIFKRSISICAQYGVASKITLNGETCAFLLAFNYLELEREHPEEFAHFFNSSDALQNEGLTNIYNGFKRHLDKNSEYIYLLAVAVDEKHRRKGFATSLLKQLCLEYNEYIIFADVTNPGMRIITERQGFKAVENNVSGCDLVFKKAELISEPVGKDGYYVAIPKDLDFISTPPIATVTLKNAVCDAQYPVFHKVIDGEGCEVALYKLDAYSLLCMQAYINIADCIEHTAEHDGKVFFYYTCDVDANSIEVKTLEELKKERNTDETRLIVDICTSIPMSYSEKLLSFNPSEKAFYSGRVITALDFRTEYEAGVPIAQSKEAGFKKRIRRLNLGKVNIKIKSEMELMFNQKHTQEQIGEPIEAMLVLSIDNESQICVLHMLCFSFESVLTQYLDSVSRNQLEVIVGKATDGGDESVNLYQYLYDNFGLNKVGTAKSFITGFEEKKNIKKEVLASVLFTETYYENDTGLGSIIEEDLLSMINLPHGVSTYNYADVIVGSNVVMQMSPNLFGPIELRIIKESTTLFYIELVLFEEAAIGLADQKIKDVLSNINDIKPSRILREYGKQLKEYASTIDFWKVQMNYPSSKLAVENNRKYFKTEELLEQYHRNQGIFQKLYEVRSDYADRMEASTLSFIGATLTVLSLLDILWAEATSLTLIGITAGVVGVLLLLKELFLFSGKQKRKKKKKK